jgi:hypothetical protein
MSYSRRQLYAMGETFGDSATRMEVGGRIVYGGGGSSAPAPQPTTRVTESGPTVTNRTTANEIPNYLTDASQDLIARGQALTSRPYEAYTGARVAEFSPDMQSAFGRMRNQQIAPQIGEATGLASLAGQRAMDYSQFQQGVQQYMNPYMQGVVDINLREAQENADRQSAILSSQAGMQNAFGGSGAALRQRALTRDTARQLSDIQAQGLDRAYQSAVGQYNQGIAGGLQAAGALGGLGQQQFGQEMDVTKGLGASGDVQRQREQALLDVGYGDYLTAQKYPYEQLAFQQGLVSGVPYSTTQRTSEISQPGKQVSQLVEPPKEQPNPASQLIGAGTALYGASGGAGNAKGGLIHSYAGGGGISSLNQPQLAAMADDMSDQQLVALQQDPTQGPVTLGVVAEALLNRDKIRAAGIGQLAATTPPPERTVVAEALGGGISDLGAPNLDNMDEVTAAGGGIIAFDTGGSTSPFGDLMRGAYGYLSAVGNPETNPRARLSELQSKRARAEQGFFEALTPAQKQARQTEVAAIDREIAAAQQDLSSLTRTAPVEGRDTAVMSDEARKRAGARERMSAATPVVAEGITTGKLGTDKAADKTVTNKGAAPNAGLSALRPPPTGMDDILKLARENAANQSVAEAEAAKIETDALAAKRTEQEAAAEKAKTSYSDREERLKKREEGMEGEKERNLNTSFIEAGLAIMAGESSNALLNIAKGARLGLQGYEARLEKINANKEKLDDDFSRLYELREAKVTAEGDKLREIKQEEARLKAGGIRNLSAISSALANTEIKVKETEFERGFELFKAHMQRQTSLDVAKINNAAANRTPSEIQMVERIMAEKKIPFSEALAFVTGAKRAPVDTEKLRGEWLDMTKRMQINRDYPNVKTFEDYVTVMGSGGGSGGASGGYKVLGVR